MKRMALPMRFAHTPGKRNPNTINEKPPKREPLSAVLFETIGISL
jgi:hypothetical protein